MKLVHLSQIPETGVSHNPDIKKKVLIAKGAIPHLMTFGQCTFLPGQSVETHAHPTMYEVFFIQSGRATFVVNDQPYELITNDCFTIEPGELHSQSNPHSNPVTWLYLGISTD